MNWLLQMDQQLLLLINKTWSNPNLDQFFIFLTNAHKIEWVKFGLLPLVLIFWLFKHRTYALRALLVVALAIAASDLVAYRIVKPVVQRTRPNHVEGLDINMRQPKPANGYGFPSNHAANSFAGATVLAWYYPALAPLFFIYAFLVAYSRPYLGVHYPLDVIAGGFIGWLIAYVLTRKIIFKFQAWRAREFK